MTKESPKLISEETAPGISSEYGSARSQPVWGSGAPTIPQSHPEDAPAGWVDVQEELAESLNLSILLVDGHQPPALALSNNNSICEAFQSSPEYVRRCDPYCGDAHRRALSAGSMIQYKCHAGLQCFTMPVQIGRKKDLAAIGGRAFLSVADYRALVDRFRAGELNDLLNRQPFDNVIFAEAQRLEQLARRLDRAMRKFASPLEDPESKVKGPTSGVERAERTHLNREAIEVGGSAHVEGRPVNGSNPDLLMIADSLVDRDEIEVEGQASAIDSRAEVETPPPYHGVAAVAQSGSVIGEDTDEVHSGTSSVASEAVAPSQAKTVSEVDDSPATSVDAAPDLQVEIDRLRRELEYRTHLAQSLQSFLERISSTDPDKTYNLILTHSRELLQAERASLWVFDEGSNEIILRAAAGFVDAQKDVGRLRIGEGISGQVLESGQPLIVDNMLAAGLTAAPAERNYKTNSFISYPITMGGRKIGVLNVTDKAGGGSFDSVDLGLLDVIGPQIAVALERAEWQERAMQFQLMSITDPLTGLLNRRYLEERLTEELNRSKRYSYPMSCLMIDIDDFKSYNDRNGHQAGDVALKITAHSLKAALRSADIACRYGGEEFCVLLPQTSLNEAGVIAERMRQKVTETDYPYGKSQPRGTVSISIGISTFGKHIDTPDSVIAAADRALYNAKHLGKNRIEFYVDNLTATR
jgi:diguanylate cyclase (GGDEF)-like protein